MGTQLGPTTNPSNYTQEEVDKKLNREREVLEREKTELVEKQCEDPKDSSKTFRPPGVFNVREEVEKYLKSERESWAREKEELEKTAKYASVSAALEMQEVKREVKRQKKYLHRKMSCHDEICQETHRVENMTYKQLFQNQKHMNRQLVREIVRTQKELAHQTQVNGDFVKNTGSGSEKEDLEKILST